MVISSLSAGKTILDITNCKNLVSFMQVDFPLPSPFFIISVFDKNVIS